MESTVEYVSDDSVEVLKLMKIFYILVEALVEKNVNLLNSRDED